MIVNLKTNYEHNGKLGELVKPCCNTLYCIRLDRGGTVLKIKLENIMSLRPAPYISEHSIFLHLNEMAGSVWDYVRIHEEPGKGQGVQASVDIAKGTRLINCPEEKQIYFFIPARGGFQYEPNCYALEMTELNTPNLTPRTQYFVNALYDIFLGKENNVCVQAERYIGNVCLNGGCKKCGISIYTMAALKQVALSSVQSDGTYCNDTSNHYVVDNVLLASKYQFNDIIMTVDFIMQNICKIEPGQVKAFAEHVWRLVGVWKLNAFAGYMPMDTVTSILDPLKKQIRIARTTHLVQWLERIKVLGLKMEDTNTLHEEKSEMLEQITRLKIVMQETGDLLYPALKIHEVTDGMYDSWDMVSTSLCMHLILQRSMGPSKMIRSIVKLWIISTSLPGLCVFQKTQSHICWSTKTSRRVIFFAFNTTTKKPRTMATITSKATKPTQSRHKLPKARRW